MNTPPMKNDVSSARRRLIEIMQRITFGRIEGLVITDGQPVLDPPPKITRARSWGSPFVAEQHPHWKQQAQEHWGQRPIRAADLLSDSRERLDNQRPKSDLINVVPDRHVNEKQIQLQLDELFDGFVLE